MVRFEAPASSGSPPGPGARSSGSRATASTSRSSGTTGHPPHPHADERVVAPLPHRRELAAAAPPDAGADRGRRLGCRVLQRSGRRDVPRARRPPPPRARRARARPRAAPTPTSTAASSCCCRLRRPAGAPSPRCCSTSGCSAASATCTGARSCGPGELSPFAPVGDLPEADAVRLVNVAATLLRAEPASAERVTRARRQGWAGGVRPHRAARAGAARRRSRPAGPASTPASCTGARAARSASIPGQPRGRRRRRRTATRPRRSSSPTCPGDGTQRLRSSRRRAKRSPDQVSSIAHTLVSTQPLGQQVLAQRVLGDVGGHAARTASARPPTRRRSGAAALVSAGHSATELRAGGEEGDDDVERRPHPGQLLGARWAADRGSPRSPGGVTARRTCVPSPMPNFFGSGVPE